MAVNVNLNLLATILETLSLDSAAEAQVSHNSFNITKTLNASSTPAATKVYAEECTGTENLDLTALDGTTGAVDATGLKLQVLLVNNLSDSDDLEITDGTSDPYSLNDTDGIQVPPGASMLWYFADQLADVASGAKAIDFTPAAGESYQVLMVFG